MKAQYYRSAVLVAAICATILVLAATLAARVRAKAPFSAQLYVFRTPNPALPVVLRARLLHGTREVERVLLRARPGGFATTKGSYGGLTTNVQLRIDPTATKAFYRVTVDQNGTNVLTQSGAADLISRSTDGRPQVSY